MHRLVRSIQALSLRLGSLEDSPANCYRSPEAEEIPQPEGDATQLPRKHGWGESLRLALFPVASFT